MKQVRTGQHHISFKIGPFSVQHGIDSGRFALSTAMLKDRSEMATSFCFW
jgi:hypothetical protein